MSARKQKLVGVCSTWERRKCPGKRATGELRPRDRAKVANLTARVRGKNGRASHATDTAGKIRKSVTGDGEEKCDSDAMIVAGLKVN